MEGTFRVRLNCIDYYRAKPTRYDPILRSDVRNSQLPKEPEVPVVRVFGATETGQKVCAHIHGAFPYLFVEYTGGLAPHVVGAYIYQLHLSIDHALAASYRRAESNKKPKYVARITLVKGIPFYGYHVGYKFYMKIYMLNPVVMTRLADILQQGLVMNRKFQPYEAHLQYLLQFMTDYNLYGCGYIETKEVSFRAPVPEYEGDDDSTALHIWHSQSIPPETITSDDQLPRVSHCSIEVDICVEDILNRKDVKERALHHDFIERSHPLPADVKLVNSMAGLWKDEAERRKRRLFGMNPKQHPKSSPFTADALVSMSNNPRDSQPSGWIHEEEYKRQIGELIAQEPADADGDLSFETFIREQPYENTVQTVLESVEDIYPQNLLPKLGLTGEYLEIEGDPASSIVVDEQGIRDLRANRDSNAAYPDDPDEEPLPEPKPDEDHASQNAVQEPKAGVAGLGPAGLSEQKEDFPHRIMPNPTERTEPPKSIHGLAFLGVGVSGLRTGRRPRLPLYKKVLAEVVKEGLISKIPSNEESRAHVEGVNLPLKRRHSDPRDEAEEALGRERDRQFGRDVKRPRSVYGLVLERKTLSSTGQADDDQKPLSPQQRSQGAGQKRRGNHTLNFNVVKDPNDPSTRLRLSQQTAGSQFSQGSNKTDHSLHKYPPLEASTPSTPAPAPVPTLATGLENTATKKSPNRPLFLAPPHKVLPFRWANTESRPLLWDSAPVMYSVGIAPPTVTEVLDTMQSYGLPDVIHQDAFYSMEKDVPPRMREYAGREFRLEGNTLPFLPGFDPTGQSPATFGLKPENGFAERRKADSMRYERRRRQCSLKTWELAEPAPSYEEVNRWWEDKAQQRRKDSAKKVERGSHQDLPATQRKRNNCQSQIEAPTPKNKHGFKYSQRKKSTSVQHEAQYMSTMSVEVHVNTRGKLMPNPEEDEVQCIFWCIQSDANPDQNSEPRDSESHCGIVVSSQDDGTLAQRIRSMTSVQVVEESSELDIMVTMVNIVRSHDPDVLTGYEVHGGSWGYLIERARFKYEYDLCDEFSRMKSQSHGRIGRDVDRWGFNTTSTIRVTGRHMINIWRAMRGELNLLQYTMENVVWHMLHRRIPHYSYKSLTDWFTCGRPAALKRVLDYYLIRTKLDLEILETNELIPRTSEQARLLGVDFFSVFSRGSQYKVESIMFRIAKPENFLLVSPSRKQVGGQNALECLPLVMEPQSAFYSSPVLVLDFQSLYPSVMIAYNYCYSTFLGRITNWRGTSKMGFTEYRRQEGLLRLLKDHVNIAPNGMMYTKPEIRKSLLAKMLTEILETRVMVKSGMKQDKDDRTLQQLLNHRQLALKLLANVTYGYTSASFSGRMPCSEIADSIVQTGRETLERSIAYIHSIERWGAEVVYGDTDSLFVHLKGKTREQAFAIGEEIAKEITNMNPRPIKLKFEKVYHPCVLLAKKRYVGYKYESRDQLQPDFDAKGIETVRRDGTPAEQKIEEKALKLLFETADLSQVKAYFQAQCTKIMRGQVSIQDFCFAREVKLGTYSDRGPPPPGALISTRRMLEDARAEPQYGERVPYVVISGGPGARLIDRCVAPEDLLHNPHCSLDAEYYISKNLIPPLERIFNLVGANVKQWYDEMPKVQRIRRVDIVGDGTGKKKTLEAYLKSASCAVCGVKVKKERSGNVCARCARDAPVAMVRLQTRLNREEDKLRDMVKVCQTCAGISPLVTDVACDSKDCPVFYSRVKQATRVATERSIVGPVLRELAEWGVGQEALQW
jgi:DNA polymerase zeta